MKKTKIPPRVESRFDLLVQAVEGIRDYGIFMLDPSGNILTWNKGAERLKGYTAREAIGMNFSNFYTPEDLQRNHPQNELKLARRVGRYEEEGWRLRKDGTRFWANIVITRIKDKKGRLVGFSKVTRDLTQKREMEERLRQSEERFRLLVEGVKDYAIYMLDPSGRVASWNEGARRIKGYDAQEIIGQHFSVFYSPEEVTEGKCEYELKETELTGRYEDEGWRIRKDGSRFWAGVMISAIRDKNRRLLGFTKITRDLTERKRSEDRLQRAYSDLERRVIERTSALATANESLERREAELEEALRARDEFLSIASHELKTPITSLKMQLQILDQKARAGSLTSLPLERLGKAFDISLRQVDRLNRLIDDLLDVARSRAKRLSFNFERVNLTELVREVVERYSMQIEAAHNRVTLDLRESVIATLDRMRIDQVIVNLITNALKYAPGSQIRITLTAQDGLAELSIADNGPGIAMDSKDKLFERFERGANAGAVGGLGLGLYISKQIVDGHHGTIEVNSAPGRGAEFKIRMPLEFTEEKPMEARP